MMAAALALARCGPAQRTRRQCLLAASRRARSASASTSGSSAAPAFPRHAVEVPRRGAHARRGAPRAFASSAASAVDADADLRLPPPGSVHLWLFDPDDADDAAILSRYETEVLSADERASVNADAPVTDGARAQVVRSRALMRCVLARYCGKDVPPNGLRFELGERGKPSLAGYVSPGSSDADVAPPPPLRFSLSHTNKLLALAVTSAPRNASNPRKASSVRFPFDACHEVGVDCEDERRRTSGSADRLAKRWLSADEHAFLESVEDDETRASRFMRLWTLKEAYVKALGTGIAAHPFAQFDISMTPNDANDKDEDEARERVELRERSTTPRERDPEALEKENAFVVAARGGGDEADEASASTRPRHDWAASACGWRFTLIRVKRGEGLICAVCAWAGLPGGGSEGNAEAKRFERRSADDAEDDATSAPGSVFVRWTVPLLGDLEPEAKPPPEIVAASAR